MAADICMKCNLIFQPNIQLYQPPKIYVIRGDDIELIHPIQNPEWDLINHSSFAELEQSALSKCSFCALSLAQIPSDKL